MMTTLPRWGVLPSTIEPQACGIIAGHDRGSSCTTYLTRDLVPRSGRGRCVSPAGVTRWATALRQRRQGGVVRGIERARGSRRREPPRCRSTEFQP